jgi:hypothetical protein
MDLKEFKKIIDGVLTKHGFIVKNKNYIRETEELIVAISYQKSNYDLTYYINYSILIKNGDYDMCLSKSNNIYDLFGRFIFLNKRKKLYSIGLDTFDKEKLEMVFEEKISKEIEPIFSYGLKGYLKINPNCIHTASLKVKNYLGVS